MWAQLMSVLATIVVAGSVAVVYARGVAARRRRGLRRPTPRAISAMLAGVAITAVAVSGPIDVLADQLFWIHMIQHLLLIAVAAPLIVIGGPLLAFGELAPRAWRRAAGQIEARLWRSSSAARRAAGIALTSAMFVLLAWHAPIAFDAALRNGWLHALEHLTLLLSAAAFWWPVLTPGPRARIGAGLAIAGVVAASTVMAGLGAALIFSPVVWYPSYRSSELVRGIEPLADQQIAGSIMWIPSSLLYLAIVAWLFLEWIGRADAPTGRPPGIHGRPRPPRDSGTESVGAA
jgi:putative membrane protein